MKADTDLLLHRSKVKIPVNTLSLLAMVLRVWTLTFESAVIQLTDGPLCASVPAYVGRCSSPFVCAFTLLDELTVASRDVFAAHLQEVSLWKN